MKTFKFLVTESFDPRGNAQKIAVTGGESFGPIRFGASSEAVQKSLVSHKLFGKFMKTKSAKNPALDYGGFHVYFINDKCVAVELFEDSSLVPTIGSFPVFPCTKKDLIDKLLKMSADSWEFIIGDGGLTSRLRSVGISFNGDKVESVLVGAKGYYDKD